VGDFGLAKRTNREDGLTDGSGAVGTPGYMAPEQTRGKEAAVDARTDVYGLGATLYHLVTGSPPFTGPQPEVTNAILNTPPVRPRAVRPEIPAALEGIILKCLEKKPADRYPNAAALAEDLQRFLAGGRPGPPELPGGPRAGQPFRHNRRLVVRAALAVLVLAGVFALGAALWPGPKPGEPPDPLGEIRKEL